MSDPFPPSAPGIAEKVGGRPRNRFSDDWESQEESPVACHVPRRRKSAGGPGDDWNDSFESRYRPFHPSEEDEAAPTRPSEPPPPAVVVKPDDCRKAEPPPEPCPPTQPKAEPPAYVPPTAPPPKVVAPEIEDRPIDRSSSAGWFVWLAIIGACVGAALLAAGWLVGRAMTQSPARESGEKAANIDRVVEELERSRKREEALARTVETMSERVAELSRRPVPAAVDLAPIERAIESEVASIRVWLEAWRKGLPVTPEGPTRADFKRLSGEFVALNERLNRLIADSKAERENKKNEPSIPLSNIPPPVVVVPGVWVDPPPCIPGVRQVRPISRY